MEDINVKSVRYSKATDEKLEKISVKLGRPKKLVVIQMVNYFYGTKKDPIDFNDELLKKELVNGVSRIISFFKKQEKDFLLPMFTDSNGLTIIAKEHTEYFKIIWQHLQKEEKKSEGISNRIGQLEKEIARTHQYCNEKSKLKSSFREILNYYINQRESLGWPVSAAKKEELQSHVRKSLENI